MAKNSKESCQVIDTKDYISDAVLDAIYAIEGHEDGVDRTVDKPTTYYGITDNGLKKLKELRDNFYVYVPERLLKLKLDDVTKEDAREIAAYNAVHNSMIIDSHFGDNHTFMNLPLDVRSAVLSVYHTGGVPDIAKSWKDPEMTGSIMKAFETGSKEKIALALLSNSDGSLFKGKAGGRLNRYLAGVRLMYDTENNSFPDKKTAGKVYKEWNSKPYILNSVATTLKNLDRDMEMKWQREESARRMAYYAGQPKTDETNNMSQNNLNSSRISTPPPVQDEQAANQGYAKFATDFTKWLKKYFTKDIEEANNVTGNTDINMQQGVAPTGGIANK